MPILPNASVQMNFVGLYKVTQFEDKEGHDAFLTYSEYGTPTNVVPYVSLVGNNTLRFFTNSFKDIGIHKYRL